LGSRGACKGPPDLVMELNKEGSMHHVSVGRHRGGREGGVDCAWIWMLNEHTKHHGILRHKSGISRVNTHTILYTTSEPQVEIRGVEKSREDSCGCDDREPPETFSGSKRMIKSTR